MRARECFCVLAAAVTLSAHNQVQERFECPSCKQCYCLNCDGKWHGKDTCEEAEEKKNMTAGTQWTDVIDWLAGSLPHAEIRRASHLTIILRGAHASAGEDFCGRDLLAGILWHVWLSLCCAACIYTFMHLYLLPIDLSLLPAP